ncbi:lipopolysaccharide biosynthesis protein [Ochrobactrum sp. Q0168]|uniref:lipopolysaccharide biosynthesis protein n=1 Tax=Ochrobactrum sp. Q0168 TaxID=2793241 RepID=UPI0018EE358F|nr:lipopolysaccharide biosynthesis protein [Ochrobactrum sp. Q0168]
MVEQNNKGKAAVLRPLLAYAPEFLDKSPDAGSARTTAELAEELLAEREHRRRRDELLRRKREMLEGAPAAPSTVHDPAADMRQRMNAIRAELQSRLEPETAPQTAAPAPDLQRQAEPEHAVSAVVAPAAVAQPAKPRGRWRLRWGRILGFTMLGGLLGLGYAALEPRQYHVSVSLQVFPSERRSEIASEAVLNRAAQLARIQSPQDFGPPPLLDQLRHALDRLTTAEGEAAPATQSAQTGAALLRPHLEFSQVLDSGIVTVEAKAATQQTATAVANAVAQAFRDQLTGSGGAPDAGLPERLQVLEADAVSAKAAVEAFRASRNFGDGDRAALEKAFAEAKAETARIGAEAGRLSSMTAESLLRDGLPEDMRSGVLGALVEQYRAAGKSEAAKSVAAAIDREIANQRSLIQAGLRKAVENEQKAASAMTGLDAAPASDEDRNRLQAMERDLAARQALYDDAQMRAAKGDMSTLSATGATVRLVAPANLSSGRHGLSLQTSVLAGLLGGLWLGLFSCLFGSRSVPAAEQREPDEAEVEDVLETYGETRLAAVIREANERWEVENNRADTVAEADELQRTIDDVRANRGTRF